MVKTRRISNKKMFTPFRIQNAHFVGVKELKGNSSMRISNAQRCKRGANKSYRKKRGGEKSVPPLSLSETNVELHKKETSGTTSTSTATTKKATTAPLKKTITRIDTSDADITGRIVLRVKMDPREVLYKNGDPRKLVHTITIESEDRIGNYIDEVDTMLGNILMELKPDKPNPEYTHVIEIKELFTGKKKPPLPPPPPKSGSCGDDDEEDDDTESFLDMLTPRSGTSSSMGSSRSSSSTISSITDPTYGSGTVYTSRP
jgi:hypothetical protein